MRELTVKHTTRNDGNGKPVPGYYVVMEGVAVGPAHATYGAATVTMIEFARDTRRQLACFNR